MNAEVKPIKTAAETALAETFASAKARLPGGKPIAVKREEAFKRFEGQGLPHRRVEEWKYTDLRALMRDAKPLAAPPNANAKARAKSAGKLFAGIEARRLVFVDGAFAAELSDVTALEPGLTIKSLAAALSAGDTFATKGVGEIGPINSDVALALNTAFMGDGAVIHVEAGTVLTRPLLLLFVYTGDGAASVFDRSLVVVGSSAQATIIEAREGPEDIDYQVNAAMELIVGDGAKVDHVKINGEGSKALHVSSLVAELGAGAEFRDLAFTTGGGVVRHQIFLRFAGENSNAMIAGATLVKGKQHVDTTLVVDHAVGHCQSRELFKSVLDDDSRMVFQGKIIVRQDAQKTDGKMASHALLLSENAEADNKPELEIFADDVVCGHGATAGAIDEELLFYLKARGIPHKEAEALLIQAFVGEAIETLAHEGLKEALNAAAATWLAKRT